VKKEKVKMQIIESATNINKGMTITFENGCRAFVSRLNGHVTVTVVSKTGKHIRPNTKLDSILKNSVKNFLKI
jgi:hypothetical protein